MPRTLEDLVTRFGEEHREFIAAAIQFLDIAEPSWALEHPIDREGFIGNLLDLKGEIDL